MISLEYTALDEIPKIREHLRTSFRSRKALDINYRKEQLLQLAYLIQDNEGRFQDAIYQDIGRPKHETNLFDLGAILGECLYAYNHIDEWTKPQHVPFNIKWSAFSPKVYKQAKGTVLIITPFNFPLYCLAPITGAIAAGCAVVVKPSELTPATSNLLAELFPKYLDHDMYRIINGGVEETTKLLELQWDHILYTGGSKVGRIVATAAAKHLTPVTLELGGKCPAIVDENTDFDFAAKRLLWGKMVNAGQTCAAPDYIIVVKSAEFKLIEALKKQWSNFYGTDPYTSPSFSRIISDAHWNRLWGVLRETKGQIIAGGQSIRAEKYIAPTLVQGVTAHDSLMKDEIFGPIFPILSVPNIDAAVKYVNDHDHPLALYVFSKDAKVREHVRKYTLSGAVVQNDTLMHGSMPVLPFGGVGGSGYGSHKGRYSFNMFVHERGVLYSPNWIDLLMSMRFPPYTDKTLRKIKRITLPTIPYPRPGRKRGTSWQWPLLVVSVALVIYKQNAIRKALQG